MSDPSHHGPSEASAGHDHHYDGIPANEAGPDEPRTPGWLTLLGVVLVLGVLFLLALRGPEEVKTAAASAAPDTTAAPAQAPSAPAPFARPQPPPGGTAAVRPVPMLSAFPRVPRPPGSARPRPLRPQPAAPGAAP